MREIDYKAVEAAKDTKTFETFLNDNEIFIIKCAFKVVKRYITKSDDEWSISLHAFSQAITDYNLEKGSFYAFAELVIKRRLIDYIRQQKKHQHEITVDPILFSTEPSEEDYDHSVQIPVTKQIAKESNNSLTLEITSANDEFSSFGFTFYDLTTCSPQAAKTKSACVKAVNYLLDNTLLATDMMNTKQLPIKIISKNTKVPRKLLERHRKYIIAAVILLHGDYPELSQYLWYIREEKSK